MPHAACQTSARWQCGTGMAGFLLAAIPVLTLGLGGVEAAHWANLRQTLSLALMESARAGATHQGRPQTIADAFEQALRMAYPDPQAAARTLQERRNILGNPPWHIRIVHPSPEAFLDHADPDLRGPRDHPGQRLIRNDHQAHQQRDRLAQGWPSGRGPRSGLTIHEANTLVLELWWPHRPLIPGTTAIIRALAPLADDPAQARLMAAGYLPFRRKVTITMQSHPAAWPDLNDGRVTHGSKPPQAWSNLPMNPAPGATSPPAPTGPAPEPLPGPDTPPGQGLPDTGNPDVNPGHDGTDGVGGQHNAGMSDTEGTPDIPEAAACETAT